MGYGFYVLADGREAGYTVTAECDTEGCEEEVSRGMDALCADYPHVREGDGQGDWGCGDYFCQLHQEIHDCSSPPCGSYSVDGDFCMLVKGHEAPHFDADSSVTFTQTEEEYVAEHGEV